MSLIAELKQALYDLPLANKPDRKQVAHFCEHDGLCIRFTRARTLWHAVTPSAIKPWWIFLEPLRNESDGSKRREYENNSDQDTNHNNKNENALEVEENA